ncbi:hypothetical protein BC828DRAFT_389011 [Blastocladiella britannica]|nr:hypothetical protein BC828DRAFT_389011 [Blastocladiella britannica]
MAPCSVSSFSCAGERKKKGKMASPNFSRVCATNSNSTILFFYFTLSPSAPPRAGLLLFIFCLCNVSILVLHQSIVFVMTIFGSPLLNVV